MAEGYHGLHEKLVDRFGERGGETVYTFFTCLLALGASGLAAYAFRQPLLFPSLGPTALLFFRTPMAKNASPRDAILGHLVAIAAGWVSLALFGLLSEPDALRMGVNAQYVGAAALSVALTGATLSTLGVLHPPAGATTLIVSLGLLTTPTELSMIAVGVVLLAVAGWVTNRMAGVPVPVWSAKE
jgi:CBS domain-containing membrane protein